MSWIHYVSCTLFLADSGGLRRMRRIFAEMDTRVPETWDCSSISEALMYHDCSPKGNFSIHNRHAIVCMYTRLHVGERKCRLYQYIWGRFWPLRSFNAAELLEDAKYLEILIGIWFTTFRLSNSNFDSILDHWPRRTRWDVFPSTTFNRSVFRKFWSLYCRSPLNVGLDSDSRNATAASLHRVIWTNLIE